MKLIVLYGLVSQSKSRELTRTHGCGDDIGVVLLGQGRERLIEGSPHHVRQCELQQVDWLQFQAVVDDFVRSDLLLSPLSSSLLLFGYSIIVSRESVSEVLSSTTNLLDVVKHQRLESFGGCRPYDNNE